MKIDKYCYVYKEKIGEITIGSDGEFITKLLFGNHADLFLNTKEIPLIEKTACQLKEYLNGNSELVQVPIKLRGTNFQMKVWNVLKQIPYGQTRSYKEIAMMIDNPKACRAVGMANNRNPIPIIIPCHRVIGSDGSLVGYGGGMRLKQYLLNLEGK
ncbi:methylated-DNA--[protein]-cysteine S-methyltransferase [Anaerosacchariphilus polymeriproducens]|uniref:Methylated-DNA--protein-cysteine methyltransferase n=1 Tax=Anaerosacchariphilus polymeriproducens TaxID=1812858 RepID=A0A371AQX4_9FIRM|nr:methylated-DNA--[protein]-cysteine S-methyltransferase [Anaerosacchariphilus polymeriproducens]RDU21981.1 methylated-DNA--[protein]-cysteine S-methyltransferase [Anaerosacchariphilus polymeriproducens]